MTQPTKRMLVALAVILAFGFGILVSNQIHLPPASRVSAANAECRADAGDDCLIGDDVTLIFANGGTNGGAGQCRRSR